MILFFLLATIVLLIQGVFSFLPTATLADIPVVGDSVRSILVTAVTSWNSFMQTFPYTIVLWEVFIYVIIPFEFAMMVLKLFLGSRSPGAH